MSISLAIEFDHSTGTDRLKVTYTDHGDESSWNADIPEDSDEGSALLQAIDAVWRHSDDPEA